MKERSIRFVLYACLAAATALGTVVGSASSAFAYQAQPAYAYGTVIGTVSPGIEKYFTVNMREGSTARDTAVVAQYFRRFGLQVSSSPDNLILFAHGTYGQAGAAAHTGFARVLLNGEQFTRNTSPESYPPEVASRIVATTMYDGPRMRPMNMIRPLTILLGPGGGYTPTNIATYYDYTPIYSAGFKGTGQNVAIVACGTALAADISKYESVFGIPSNLPTIVPVDGGSTTQDAEPTLDVEGVVSVANAVKIFLYVVPVTCSIGSVVDAFAKVEADNATKHFSAISHSYGVTEQFYAFIGGGALMTAEHTDIHDLETGGAFTFVSSGDTGAWPPGSQFIAAFSATVQYPASDSDVIAVGGTSATSKSTTLIARNKELGWGGSGGGVSSVFAIPARQVGVVGVESTTMRNVPDVAFDSDLNTGYPLVFTPPGMAQGTFIAGGTSAAAPRWAATLALVNQKRVALGKLKLVKVGADLYAAAKVVGPFVDITIGDNGFYSNKVGFDCVTGVGVPDGNKLWLNLTALPSGS